MLSCVRLCIGLRPYGLYLVRFLCPWSSPCSLPGSSVHGILQVRILEWGVISFSRDLPDPGIKPSSPTLQADWLPSEPPEKPFELRNFELRNKQIFSLLGTELKDAFRYSWGQNRPKPRASTTHGQQSQQVARADVHRGSKRP